MVVLICPEKFVTPITRKYCIYKSLYNIKASSSINASKMLTSFNFISFVVLYVSINEF